MLKYDEKKKRLYAYKHEFAIPPAPSQEASLEKRSFDRYIQQGLLQDVVNEFMPRLMEAIKADDDEIVLQDIKVEQDDSPYWKDKSWKVRAKFNSIHTMLDSPDCQYLTIMSLPYIEDDGRLYHDRKYYSYIKMLEQEPTVSYDEKSPIEKILKVKLPKGFLSVVYGASGPKMQFSDLRSKSSLVNYDLFAVLFAMAMMEGYDAKALFNEFHNFLIHSKINTTEKFEEYRDLLFSSKGSINQIAYLNDVVPRLTGTPIEDKSRRGTNGESQQRIVDSYKAVSVRDTINEVLSLDRALGETLGEDVYSVTEPGKLLYREGTTITRDILDVCRKNAVYNIFITKETSVDGYYLAETVFVPFIPKGIRMIPELEAYLPEETGMYVSRDYHFNGEDIIFFDDSTRLNKPFLEILSKCGYSSIKISEKPGRAFSNSVEDIIVYYFTEEVLSNRMFRAIDVNRTDLGTDWVYLNVNNEFEACPEYWTTYDIAALISLVFKLFQGQCTNVVTNADTGFRKRLVLIEEMYHRAFRHACIEGFQVMSNSLRIHWNSNKYKFFIADNTDNKFYCFGVKFFEYLRDNVRCLERLSSDSITNPISYISALNKINVFVPNKHSVADSQRRIAIGSYSRVDVFEIPQSHKMGVVMNQCIGNEVDLDGNMRVAYRKLRHEGNKTYLTDDIRMFSVADEERVKIADIGSIPFDENGVVHDNTQMCLCRCPSSISIDKQSFAYVQINQCEYVNVHANQPLSWASAAICHLDSNDANRATFGIAQAKQAKGQVRAQAPRVGTYANLYIPMMNDYFCVIAKDDGEVTAVCRNIDTNNEDGFNVELLLKYDNLGDKCVSIAEITNSGYSVCIRKILVKEGQRFKKGDILVTSNFMDGDMMALGKNMLVGYISTGKNYEDGSNATIKACYDMCSYKLKGAFSENTQFKRAANYIVKDAAYGRYIDAEREKIGTVGITTGSSKQDIEKPVYVDKGHGFLESCKVRVSRNNHGAKIYDGVDADFLSINPFSKGDKCSNRHGNKGVMPKGERNSRMMRLPNGMVLDIAYNPLGVISRMNIGQVRECNLGLAAEVLDINVVTDSYNSITNDEIKELLKFAHDLANCGDTDPNTICANFPNLPTSLKKHAVENIQRIQLWAGTFDERGESYLIDPATGKMTETKALIGINYVLKLIQESESKVHARAGAMAGEPYAAIAASATQGSSNHGGQKFGNMEMDALCAYGAAELIHELTNERGDNIVARSNLNAQLYLPPSIVDKYLIDSPGQRRSTTQLLYTMLALGAKCECDNGEFIPLHESNCELGAWTMRALKEAEVDIDYEPENSSVDNELDAALAMLSNLQSNI